MLAQSRLLTLLRRTCPELVCARRRESRLQTSTEYVTQQSTFDPPVKLRQQPHPFIPHLALGEVDTHLLVFPEFSSNFRLNETQEFITAVQELVAEVAADRDLASASTTALARCRAIGLYGAAIPTEYGGLGLSAKQLAWLFEELSANLSLASQLHYHNNYCARLIMEYAQKEQCDKWLPSLAAGDVAAFCLHEEHSGSDFGTIKTVAKVSPDGESFLLNGSKHWITNGTTADYFLVVASTKVPTEKTTGLLLSIFLVEKDDSVLVTPLEPHALKGSGLAIVTFRDTIVPKENLIGEIGAGFEQTMAVVAGAGPSSGAMATGVMRRVIKRTVSQITDLVRSRKYMTDLDNVKEEVSRMTEDCYTTESVAFHSAGVIDDHRPGADFSSEGIASLVTATELLPGVIQRCLSLRGGHTLSTHEWAELNDAQLWLSSQLPRGFLRLFIAHKTLETVVLKHGDLARKLANPLDNFPTAVRMFFTGRKRLAGESITGVLQHSLHPNLRVLAGEMEKELALMPSLVVNLMAALPKDLLDKQIVLNRVADNLIDFYVVTAVLSRASRSICIGLQNHDPEVLLAEIITQKRITNIKQRQKDVTTPGGQYLVDLKRTTIADAATKWQAVPVVHATTRNW